MKTRKTYEKNPIIGYLNINSLSTKILSLKEILHKAPIGILRIDETKLDETFPDAQFMTENYQFLPFRRDRNNKGGGKMVFIRKELLAERLEDFETKSTETICIELLISEKKWCIIFTYRPPKYDKKVFFQELSKTIRQAINKYDNILVAGDLNIDVSGSKGLNDIHFSELTDTFNLANLVKTSTSRKKHLDNKKIVGTVLMDLSKAFDCIPHDFLTAKLHAYGFNKKALTFLYSYLKRRKQSVKINDTESFFQILLSAVPQGSILGPILFNLFINDLFFFIKEAELANFADDNIIYVDSKDLTELLVILQKECETAINWFKTNNMIISSKIIILRL